MPGYSGTPLPKKLGLKPDLRVQVVSAPSDVAKELKAALGLCNPDPGPREPLDFVLWFVKTQAELKQRFPAWARRLKPAGMLWIAWPKKSSGVASDLGEGEVRAIGLAAGLVDVKVCAVSEIWSGLKFVIRLKDRPKGA
jgi:hypothetical protein